MIKDKSLETGKLPKKFKKDWIKALRSGKYQQTTNTLKREIAPKVYGYCCLGVAADIMGCRVPIMKLGDENVPAGYLGGISFEEEEINVVPVKGYTKIPAILHGMCGVAATLSEMNDNGSNFEEVAEYIEENL